MRKRKHDRSWEIQERLEAQLRGNLDDPRAVRAYADWLCTQGDSLGELMLLSLRAEETERQQGEVWIPDELKAEVHSCRARKRAEEMIHVHWREWFDDVEKDDVTLTWRHGLVRSARLNPGAPGFALGRLLHSQPLRFVESVDAGEMIGQTRSLHDLAGPKELVLPATLAMDWTHALRQLGPGLTLTGSPRELTTWRRELRSWFPGVKLRPRLPLPAIDVEYGGPHASREPRWAGHGPTECARTMNDPRPFRFCAACAGEDTELLAVLGDSQFLRPSTTYESVCHECGWFTWYEVFELHPSNFDPLAFLDRPPRRRRRAARDVAKAAPAQPPAGSLRLGPLKMKRAALTST